MQYHQIVVRHAALNRYRVISGTDWYAVNQKAQRQYTIWEHEWSLELREREEKRIEAERRANEARSRKQRAKRQAIVAQCVDWANRQTADAQKALADIRATLEQTLGINDAVDWDALEDRSAFLVQRPLLEQVAPPRDIPSPGEAPHEGDPQYEASLGIVGRLSASKRKARESEARARFESDLARWATKVREVRDMRDNEAARYATARRTAEEAYNKRLAGWHHEKARFEEAQNHRNEALRARRRAYESGDHQAILDYSAMVLARSEYPDSYPRDADLIYDPETRLLVVDFTLPSRDLVPDVDRVEFDEQKMDYSVHRLSENEHARLHNALCVRMVLRTQHELFESDVHDFLDAICLNGWMSANAGDPDLECVVSVKATKALFTTLDLTSMSPEVALKTLQGLGLEEPEKFPAVPQLVEGSRQRKRPAAAPEAPASMFGGPAVSDIEIVDFERLVRDTFEREVCAPDERVLVARVGSDRQIRALVVDAATRKQVRVVAHAHATSDVIGPWAVDEVVATMKREGATSGFIISTGVIGDDAKAAAIDNGIRAIDGTMLLALMSRLGDEPGRDPRDTNPLRRETEKLSE